MSFLYPLPLTLKSLRWKRKNKKKQVKDEHRQSTTAIWNKMYLLTSMSSFFEEFKEKNIQTSERTPITFDEESVCIFDIADSTMQELELDAFYNFYLSQAQFEKTPTSLVSPRIHRFDFTETIRIYQLLESFHGSEPQDTRNQTKLEGFLTSFDFLPKYDRSVALNSLINKPLTIYECVNVDENIFSMFEYDLHGTKFFRLMSWWRLANTRLQTSFRDTVASLKTAETDFKYTKRAVKCIVRLDSLVADLGLTHGSAELQASRQYVPINRDIPDSSIFLQSYKFHPCTARTAFLQSVSDDRMWMAFATGCGYYSVNACFVVLKLFEPTFDEREDVTDNVTEAVRPLAVEFYNDVIRPLGLKVSFGSYVVFVVFKSVEYFKEVMQTLQQARTMDDSDQNPLNSTITILTRLLFQLVDIIFEHKQVAEFFGEQTSFTIKITIYHFLFGKMKNAILLVQKVFQRDFITMNLLSKLCTYEPGTVSTTIYEISCAQLASCLISAYKIMHRTNPVPESCIRLHSNFPCRDFVMFIDELRIISGLQELEIETLSSKFTVRMQAIQHRFTKELEKDLCNITEIAEEANEMLKKVKYFL